MALRLIIVLRGLLQWLARPREPPRMYFADTSLCLTDAQMSWLVDWWLSGAKGDLMDDTVQAVQHIVSCERCGHWMSVTVQHRKHQMREERKPDA